MTESYSLYHGDCLEVMPTLPKGSVQMVFADLPYGVTRNSWDVALPLLDFWACVKHALNDCGITLCTATQPFASLMVVSNLKKFRYDIIWNKKLVTGHLNAKKRPLRQHESVLVFYSGAGIYCPQMTQGSPYRKTGGAPTSNYGSSISLSAVNLDGLRYPTSVLDLASERKPGVHPTQKPVALLEWLIATYTNPRDTVLDPTMGSGTTGVACVNLGRRFLGIEKDATYFAAAKARIKQAYEVAQKKEMAVT